MIYVDGVHMAADTIDELHDFAKKIGLRRNWFQDHPRHPHYDVWGAMMKRAIDSGAMRVSSREILKRCAGMVDNK